MRSQVLMIVAVMSAVALGGCGKNSTPTAEVEVRVNVCVEGGRQCFALLIPSAEIRVETVGGTALGSSTTDAAGRASVPLSLANSGEQIRITAASPLLHGGTIESTTAYPKGIASVTLQGSLAQAVSSPK